MKKPLAAILWFFLAGSFILNSTNVWTHLNEMEGYSFYFSEEATEDEDSDDRKDPDKVLIKLLQNQNYQLGLFSHFTKYHLQFHLSQRDVLHPPPQS